MEAYIKPNVYCLTATCGRHNLLERSIRFFINQDYNGDHTMLIYNNSVVPQKLEIREELPNNKKIILINNHIDSITKKPYKTLGGIYNDMITYIPEECDIVNHTDDDDIFLPNHISEGVKGLLKAQELGKIAYKPRKSYYRHPNGVELMENVLEPSIFMKYQHLKNFGYSLETTAQHMQWVQPLVSSNMILSDEEGIPTLIYNWGDHIPTFKTSGDPGNKNNFSNYRNFSQDHGNQILTPWSKAEVEEYYKTS